MKKLALQILLFSLLAFAPSASAADCSQAAANAASARGGEVLSVKANGDQCVVKIRIPGKNGEPPRVETTTVSG
ncbi:MAG: hypothetical protein KDJ48_08485 [Nitratireductor sp.]|nr:hypothetical protein [Nitratireductor sp.]MCB1459282.1 hypothetical protein [Nitratireductor sp.]